MFNDKILKDAKQRYEKNQSEMTYYQCIHDFVDTYNMSFDRAEKLLQVVVNS